MKRIVITGPESTGKTELAMNLAELLGTVYVPEYARDYVENLNKRYTYEDVESIARFQITQERIYDKKAKNVLIFDTWLIITKIWFDLVFGRCPDWVISHIRSSEIDLFLVCSTDLPWVPDQVRENGGEKREELFWMYCREIESFGFKYAVIKGMGKERTQNALNALRFSQLIK